MSEKKSNNKKVVTNIFKSYWSDEEIENALENEILKGVLRLNPRNYKEAYIRHSKLDSDVLIFDKDINRALYDDIVAVKINNKCFWKVHSEISNFGIDITNMMNIVKNSDVKKGDSKNYPFLTINLLLNHFPNFFTKSLGWDMTTINISDNCDFPESCNDWWKYFQRTGQVISIVHKMNSRLCVGSLCLPDSVQVVKYARFIPSDIRYPRLLVSLSDCPLDFITRPQDYKDVKFIASIGDWNEKDTNPRGTINQCLTSFSLIEQESFKILAESGFQCKEFKADILDFIPSGIITNADLKYRRDMRAECVFSIDPKSARDLDDALHIKELSTDNDRKLWEVGVHIADVTYYITPDSMIDEEAKKRATTVYMVHKAVPMLPRELCENLCSLHPGSDKLTYSVIYKMTDDCQIVDVWIGRTVIHSACKLSYEEAQMVLDNPDKRNWLEKDFGQIFGSFKAMDITNSILRLNHLAAQMRHNRFVNGALWLNSPKIGFTLNAERNLPLGYLTYKLGASNHLIEEWMLRANMTIAEFLHNNIPKTAFLRCHPTPTAQAIQNINKQFEQMGWYECRLDSGSTTEFQALMNRFEEGDTNHLVMVNVFNKAMQLALYFCNNNEDRDSLENCHHFALSVPLYTHFTSPIRRYPDLIVHRQITQVLMMQELKMDSKDANIADKVNWMARTSSSDQYTTDFLSHVAEYCNKKKKDAKSADESSSLLFYSLYVEKVGPFTENGIVMGILDKAFDVLMTNCGYTKRVYFDQLDAKEASLDSSHNKLTITWNTSVDCRAKGHPCVYTVVGPLTNVTIVVSAISQGENSIPKLKFVLPNPGCKLCAQLTDNNDELSPLKDISSLQSELNIIDEDKLFNILDDI